VAYTTVQALEAAGRNPTRGDLLRVVQTQPLAGPGLVPFGFAPTDHQGYTGVQMGGITGGQFVAVGPPMTATDAGAISAYTQPQPSPPASGIPPATGGGAVPPGPPATTVPAGPTTIGR
jgi:hypothetical protein